ncbi:hypothetical protein BH10PSE3_BH10PSE3_38940 [soil metagenome]
MTSDAEPKANLETLAADLLNGAMVILLGCAFPAFSAWRAIAEFSHRNSASPTPPDDWPAALSANGLFLIVLSLLLAWRGMKHIHKTLARLPG